MNAFIEASAETRAEQKAATRARILAVARRELENKGFDATNIRDVAEAAGVAAGTVILHFKDKRDLLHAALFDDLDRTWRAAKEAAKHRALEEDLARLADAFFDYYAARPVLSRALLRESLFASPPWSERFAAQVAEVHAHVASLAKEAKARAELDADVDVALFGAAFFSFYYFALLGWAQGGLPDPSRVFRRMLSQHLDGARPQLQRRARLAPAKKSSPAEASAKSDGRVRRSKSRPSEERSRR